MTYEEVKELNLSEATSSTEFLDKIKRELQITWEDEDTEKTLKEYINEGIEVLQNDIGTSINFNEDKLASGLLSTYVRYAWNKSEEFFIENNIERILKLEVKYGKD